MANADFSQRNGQAAGGFDAGSYRAAPEPDETAHLTPLQQKLAALEGKLPKAMQQRAAALVLCAAVMLAGYLGFGTAKLRAKYNEAKSWYSAGLAADGGYTLEEALVARENYAAGTITSAKLLDGLDENTKEVKMAQAALDQFAELRAEVKDGQGVQVMCLANETLGREIDTLYNKMREVAPDPMNPGGQYGQFTSAQTILNNLSYNEAVSDYEDELDSAGGILKALSGVKKVEYFA